MDVPVSTLSVILETLVVGLAAVDGDSAELWGVRPASESDLIPLGPIAWCWSLEEKRSEVEEKEGGKKISEMAIRPENVPYPLLPPQNRGSNRPFFSPCRPHACMHAFIQKQLEGQNAALVRPADVGRNVMDLLGFDLFCSWKKVMMDIPSGHQAGI